MTRLQALIERYFGRSGNVSRAQVDMAAMRTLQRLRQDPMWESDAPLFEESSPQTVASAFPGRRSSESEGGRRKSRTRWVVVALPAAAVLAIVVGGLMARDAVQRRNGVVVVETNGGSVYRVAGDKTHPFEVNERIAFGDLVRSNGGVGGMLLLADGSRVEMRTGSELTFERADDGVRIRLNRGGIIVNAAKQRAGHLYVLTKDVTVSVLGTVFLVNADKDGSRVAVIEGEVRVQQGTTQKTLLPGEQVTTNSSMLSPPVRDAITWSRNAPALLALLRQSAVVPPALAPQNTSVRAESFEEASVRPSGQTVVGSGRGGARRSPCSELFLDTARDGSITFRVQIDPRRFAVFRTTLYTLIAWAHGRDCGALNLGGLISGGPGWVGSDEWDIQALIPEGAAAYTVRQFVDGHAPELQARLRNLLTQRFQLVIRAEMKDMPVYVLTRGEGPLKLRPRPVYTGPGAFTGGKDEFGGQYEIFMNVPESNVARMLMLATGRIVLDQTGIKDGFYLDLEFAPPKGGGSSRPSLFKALEAVGLRLEEKTLPQEALFIERVEKPTEN